MSKKMTILFPRKIAAASRNNGFYWNENRVTVAGRRLSPASHGLWLRQLRWQASSK